ncbi:hypothetical protein C8A01DRAFT_45650 [Parachaetomium inaequale]|uniref:NmrA-like domain-containing protein n=1 Tax=Parachaetomium inaequale TaxID=2588326 RepID=A0AAN6SS49_9PEZI|nr:hypothetical protein C8A01DRAFT_45650 [Parachaetomium inaequale]
MGPHKVFVCGATGLQGGALARQLRALGWEVHTITRDTGSAAAQALTSIGVTVHQGSWSDSAALSAALAGCDGLFLNLVPDMTNPPAEFDDGKTVLAAAQAAGVQHVVYSSGLALPPMPADHFMTVVFKPKLDLEQALQTAGFPRWTVLRPGYFMTNLVAPKVHMLYPGSAESGLFTFAFRPTTELPMIDHEDIGKFAAAALQRPDEFHEKVIDVVSESVPVARAVETMRRVTGRSGIRAEYVEGEALQRAAAANPLLVLQGLLRDVPSLGDAAAAARKWGVETARFEQFVERERGEFDATYRNV